MPQPGIYDFLFSRSWLNPDPLLKFLLPICLVCLLMQTAPAQNYLPVARLFGVEDGLPHRQVNSVAQDRRGFIWVATNAGVARIDGLRFKIFNKADNGLRTDTIHRIMEDAAGRLWLISAKHPEWNQRNIVSVDVLDPMNGQVIPLEEYIRDKPPVPLEYFLYNGIRSAPDQPGTLFFGTQNPGGWVSWHPEKGWKRVAVPSIPNLLPLLITPEGGMIAQDCDAAFFRRTLVELDARGKVLRFFRGADGRDLSILTGGGEKSVFAMESDPAAAGASVYWEIKPGADKTRLHLSVPRNRLPQWSRSLLVEVEPGAVWLSDYEIFDRPGKILLDLLAQFPTVNNKTARAYLRDRNGGIWLANDFGLELIEIRKDHFRRFLFDENARTGSAVACRGIVQNGKNLWVNSEAPFGGLQRIDLFSGRVFPSQLLRGSCYALSPDSSGNIWSGQTGTDAPFLVKVDPVSGGILAQIPFKYSVPWSVFPVRRDQLWVGMEEGLALLDPATGQLSRPDTRNFPELDKATVLYIAPDHPGMVWLCTSRGFYKMTPSGKIVGRFWSGGQGENWLPCENLYHFYEDREGVFWLGTADKGLVRWDMKTGEKQVFSRKNGLLNDFVYAVYEDDFGHLWLPTDLGIAQFDKKNRTVRRTWLPADGVAQNEFNRISHCRGTDGTLYFGGLNGITAFHPKDFYGLSDPGPGEADASGKKLVLSDFQLFSGASGKLENQTAVLLAGGEITMQPDDRYFQLEFALLDFFSPKKVAYFYQIEGMDADWNALTEPVLRLSSLPSGSHRLKIRAQSADGLWAENELDFKLIVLPPFYLRWWFLVLVVAAILAGVWFWTKWRTAQLRRNQAFLEAEISRQTGTIRQQSEQLRKLDAAKSRFFTNITHEFRTPLTVMLGMAGQIRKEPQKHLARGIELIERNGKSLLRLVNQLLDIAKLESDSFRLQLRQSDIVPYLRYLTESVQSFAEQKNCALQFSSPLESLMMDYDPEQIKQVFVNLLSNAIKFTPAGGHIEVRATSAAGYLQVEVQDTGIGIPEYELPHIFDRFYQADNAHARQGQGTGIGLAHARELVKRMGGSISAVSVPAEGSCFTISLPVTNRSEKRDVRSENIDIMETENEAESEAVRSTNSHPLTLSPSYPLPSHRSLLLIEDNPDVVAYLKTCLESSYQLDIAENGRIGIEKALEHIPDLIISDVMMPEKDGYEVCDTLKNDERTSHIPIVLLTAKADSASRITGLRRGADAYLSKPFDPEELLVQLEMLLERQKRMIAYFSKNAATTPVEAETSEQKATYETESAFIGKVRIIIEDNFADEDFALPQLCRELNMSRSQLFRKMKALVDISPSDFIRSHRLEKARQLLETEDITVSEVAWQVGYKDVSHFSKSFQEMFGFLPSAVRRG